MRSLRVNDSKGNEDNDSFMLAKTRPLRHTQKLYWWSLHVKAGSESLKRAASHANQLGGAASKMSRLALAHKKTDPGIRGRQVVLF